MTEAIEFLEWAGCITGVIGALLVALNNAWSKWGFLAYLVSNVCWFGFGLYSGAHGLMWMQIAFMLTTLVGIYRWVLPVPVRPVRLHEERGVPRGASSPPVSER